MQKTNSTSFFLLILGFLAGCMFSAFGLQFLASHIALVTAIAIGLVGLIVLIGVLIYTFREQIFSRLYGIASTEVADLSESTSQLITSIASGENLQEIEANSKKLIGSLLYRYSWYRTQRWIIATLIAVIGTFATLGGTAVIYKQNELISNQNEAIKVANQPQFFFATEYEFNDDKIAADDVLKVKYLGGYYSELETEVITFIKATYSNLKTYSTSRDFALTGYYSLALRYEGGEGIILTMQGAKNNNLLFTNAKNEYAKLCRERKGIGDLILQRFARFKYKDVYGESHVKYYNVSGSSTFRIDPSKGKSLFEDWHEKLISPEVIDIQKIDVLNLLNNLLEDKNLTSS